MESERGQTLPLTLGGIIAILAFGFFTLNYANTLRWQVRAQDAADSAAQAILALQTQEFNEMTATLYASAVEEYRIRHLLNGMVLAAHYQGGCIYQTAGESAAVALSTSATPANQLIRAKAPAGCDYIELALEGDYDEAVARYTADVVALHRITASMNFANFSTDATALLKQIACTGTSPFGGDCAFSYGTPPYIVPRTDTEAVFMDANGVLMPSPQNPTDLASAVGSPRLNTSKSASNLFDPVQVEVYACATVPSLIPSFLGWQFPAFTAVARGAATPVMVEQDWLQPGVIVNPFPGSSKYQPVEDFGTARVRDSSGYDWYDLDFGGNGVVAQAGHYSSLLTVDEFSVYVGWWNSIPIHAFSGTKPTAEMGCSK